MPDGFPQSAGRAFAGIGVFAVFCGNHRLGDSHRFWPGVYRSAGRVRNPIHHVVRAAFAACVFSVRNSGQPGAKTSYSAHLIRGNEHPFYCKYAKRHKLYGRISGKTWSNSRKICAAASRPKPWACATPNNWAASARELISTRLVWMQKARLGLYRSAMSASAQTVRVERICRVELATEKIEPIRLASGQSFAQSFSVQEDGELSRIDCADSRRPRSPLH